MAERDGKVVHLAAHASVNSDNIPLEIRKLKRWMLWRLEKEAGRSKPSKPPYQANGARGSHSNPDTWCDFELALKTFQSSGGAFHGVGFTMGEPGLVAWDLDHVLNPRTLEIVPWADELVTDLNSYTEITPSGEGLRIFVRGDIPSRSKNTRGLPDWEGGHEGGVETYNDVRFVTVTGNHLARTPLEIKDRGNLVDDWWQKLHSKVPPAVKTLLKNDDMQKFWEGRWAEIMIPDVDRPGEFRQRYGSQSEADLAFVRQLVIVTNGDPEATEKLYRTSQMMRPKWDEPNHFADGLPGESYGKHTIRVALASFERNHNLTDTGNAKRFARIGGDRVRYADPGGWYVWDGKRLERDRRQSVYLIAEEVAKEVHQIAAEIADENIRKATLKHAKGLEQRGQIEAMLKLAQSRPPLPILSEELDDKDHLFSCENGTIENAGKLREHRFTDLITKVSPVMYHRTSRAPRWESFVKEIIPNDELRHFMQKAVGYSMTGSVKEQRFFIAFGTGKNGKSKFFETIGHCLGDYFTRIPSSALLLSRNEQHPTALMLLKGARMALAAELKEGRALNEEVAKIVTGEGQVQARLMGKDFVTFRSTAKLWIMTNHEPNIAGTDEGIWRRVTEIPFTVTIPEQDRDPDLGDKLVAEAEGVLAWMVDGWRMWLDEGLKPPEIVMNAIEMYREKMDVIQTFLEDEIMIEPNAKCPFNQVYSTYVRWAERNGERPMSSKAFGQKLTEKQFQKFRGGGNVLFVEGLQLRSKDEDEGRWSI